MTGAPDRRALCEHLITSRIAGQVRTPRENNLDHFRRMSAREPLYLLGLAPRGSWTPAEVLELMVRRCGVSGDPDHTHGPDTIDPAHTIDRLDAMAAALREVADRRGSVLVATGHPYGLMPVHTAVAGALRDTGCRLLAVPVTGWVHPAEPHYRSPHQSIDYRDGVAVLTDPDGQPTHSHSPLPMGTLLGELAAAGLGPPDLVVADHGWAGAAAQAGIPTVSFADCNDPALFVGEAEGTVLVCVPLDDNLSPALYQPLTEYLLRRAGLAG